MDDRLLASRAAAGDLDSFGQLYDRYVNRIYDFAWRTLRDPEGADAVTRSVFERAARAPADAGRAPSVAAWLFGIAHAETIARAESIGVVPVGPAPTAEEAFGTFDVPDPVQLVDTSAAGGDAELPGLTWEAAASLGPRDYALLDLDQRQHLDAGEIGHITGDGKATAQTIVARMRIAAADVMTGYAVARTGQDACPVLRSIVARHPMPPYTDDARREIQQHIAGCDACVITRSNGRPPLPVFAALATIPAPFAVKGDIWRDIAAGWARSAAFVSAAPDRRTVPAAAAGGAGFGAGSTGIFAGGNGGPDWTRNRILLFGGGALAMVVFAFGVGALVASAIGGGGGGNGAPSSTRTATVEADGTPRPTSTLGVEVPTATETVPATITPTPSITPTPAPTDTPTITPIPASPTRTPRPEPTEPPTRTPRPGQRTPTPDPDDITPVVTP